MRQGVADFLLLTKNRRGTKTVRPVVPSPIPSMPFRDIRFKGTRNIISICYVSTPPLVHNECDTKQAFRQLGDRSLRLTW